MSEYIRDRPPLPPGKPQTELQHREHGLLGKLDRHIHSLKVDAAPLVSTIVAVAFEFALDSAGDLLKDDGSCKPTKVSLIPSIRANVLILYPVITDADAHDNSQSPRVYIKPGLLRPLLKEPFKAESLWTAHDERDKKLLLCAGGRRLGRFLKGEWEKTDRGTTESFDLLLGMQDVESTLDAIRLGQRINLGIEPDFCGLVAELPK